MNKEKMCSNCGSLVNINEAYCPNCGCTSFRQDYAATSQPQEYFINNVNQNIKCDTAANSKQPKNSSGSKIAIIVLASVLVIVVAILAVVLVSKDDSVSTSVTTTAYSSTENNYPYSVGKIEGNKYVNLWANIEFDLSDEWPAKDPSEFYYQDEDTDSCFESTGIRNDETLILGIEKLFQEGYASVDEYLLDYEKVFKEKGFKIERTEMQVAQEQFKVLAARVVGEYIKVVSRQKGDKVITFLFRSNDEAKIDRFLNLVRAAY